MGAKAAIAQLFVVAAIFTAGTLYTRHHVATLQRADFSQSEYFEDSKAGNGSRYRVLKSAADTGGASYSVEVVTRAGAPAFLTDYPGSGPEHTHQQQQESLLVRAGALGYILQKRKQVRNGVLRAGDTLDIQAGTSHVLFNADNTTDLVYELTHQPPGPMGEAFFENLAGLGWDYGSIDRIHPLQVIVLFDADDTQLTDVSGLLAPVVEHLVLPVSRLLGFKAHYPSHKSKHASGHRSSSSTDAGSSAGGEGAQTDSATAGDSARANAHEEL